MRIINIVKALFILALITLLGCGGGGGNSPSATPHQDTIISGVAINAGNGTLKVTALLADGTSGTVLKAGVPVDANGHFSVSLGSYTGAILVEAANGSASVLHSAVQNVSGTATVAVTPLTELAFMHAGTTLTNQNIGSANTLIANLFNVADITSVIPVNASTSSLAFASTDMQNYSLAIAAVSQPGVELADINAAISSNTMSAQMAQTLQNSLNTFLSDSAHNKSDITSGDATLPAIGTTTVVYKLITQGSIPAGSSMKGVQLTLNIPAGYTIKKNVSVSGVAPLNSVISSNTANGKLLVVWTPANDNASLSTGLRIGEFAFLSFKVAPGTSSDINLSAFKASDENGAAIGSVTGSVTF
ncbi:MAG TPA: hypothetical protein VN642_11555 [Dongiaceae bacterium]|nr:hypothetical protein [Dongiaceae bacterium]